MVYFTYKDHATKNAEALLNSAAGTEARVVITGASGGIGRELAQQLLRVLEMRCLLAVGFLSFVAS